MGRSDAPTADDSVTDLEGGARLLAIEALSAADAQAGLALSDAAGWNQTADDWALFLRSGGAIGCRAADGRLVATASTFAYGSVAWISMVLVADDLRHRGLASALLDACVDRLRAASILPCLDATPAGAPVYRRLGFVEGFAIDRWQGTASPSPGAAPADQAGSVVPASAADLADLLALDRRATGLDRGALLADVLARPATRAWRSADGYGMVVARAGRRALQIGPLAARDEAQAIELLATALASGPPGRTVFMDLPRGRGAVAGWLESHGFTRQRPFVRMSLGAARPPVLGDTAILLAGPEFG